jgi:hypothetical protein
VALRIVTHDIDRRYKDKDQNIKIITYIWIRTKSNPELRYSHPHLDKAVYISANNSRTKTRTTTIKTKTLLTEWSPLSLAEETTQATRPGS